MTKKSKKLEKADDKPENLHDDKSAIDKKATDLVDEIKSYKYDTEPEDTVSEKIETPQETKARELALKRQAKKSQQIASKNGEITDFLTEQGLGQNARHKVFILFEEVRKIKCTKYEE